MNAGISDDSVAGVICEYPSNAIGASETKNVWPADIGACRRLQITQLAESCTGGFTGIRFSGVFETASAVGIEAHSRATSARWIRSNGTGPAARKTAIRKIAG